MRLKKGTSLLILFIFLMSFGNIDIVKAAETNISSSQEQENIILDSSNQTTATTSSAVDVITTPETQEEQEENVDSAESSVQTETETYINPMYDDLDLSSSNSSTFTRSLDLADADAQGFTTIEDASDYMRQQMVKRADTITFTVNMEYYSGISAKIFSAAIADSDECSSSEGDYLYSHFTAYSSSISYISNCVTFNYKMSYLSTYEQEQEVNTEVKNVLDSLNVYNSDEYTKIKAVHDYIVKNIKYDDSLENYSAYNAIIDKNVVCQGFASLTYKMLKELGVGVRYITGMTSGGRHGWNIGCIDGQWYNIDNTWDENLYASSGNISYRYFLKNSDDFSDHIRNEEYNTTSFNQNYPIATDSYVNSPISVTSVTLNYSNLDLKVGKTGKFTVTVLPSNASNKEVEWKSSDETIVKIDQSGNVNAIGAGSAVITCTANDGSKKSATCKVNVTNPVSVTSVKLNKTSLSVLTGKTSTLTATVSPSNAANKAVTWSSSDKKVATVDANGKITGVSKGSANITCTAKDGSKKNATCKVTVTNPVSVTSVKLNKTSLSVIKGKTSTLISTASPSTASNKAVTWKSSNTLVVTVDANGKVTGVSKGTATITCTAKDGSKKSVTCKVTVTNPISVTRIKLSKTILSLVKGKTSTLVATALPSTATNKEVTWKSSNTKIATVDSNGKITGVAKGTAIITCTAKDGSKKTVTCKVTVRNPISVTSIKLNKTSLSIIKGKTSTLTATALPSTATNKAVTWKSSNTKIATVDGNGKITGVAKGTAIITCTAKDGSKKVATCKVTVTK